MKDNFTIFWSIIGIIIGIILIPFFTFFEGYVLGYILKWIIKDTGIIIFTNALHLNIDPNNFPLFTGVLMFLSYIIFPKEVIKIGKE